MQPSSILIGIAPLLTGALALPTSATESGLLSNETMLDLAKRADFDTSVEIGDNIIIAYDQSGNPPAAFNVLWDAVENELCTAQGCDFNAQKCVPALEGGLTICISARGDFLPENRNDIIHGTCALLVSRVTWKRCHNRSNARQLPAVLTSALS